MIFDVIETNLPNGRFIVKLCVSMFIYNGRDQLTKVIMSTNKLFDKLESDCFIFFHSAMFHGVIPNGNIKIPVFFKSF